jgi:glutathione peroxidase
MTTVHDFTADTIDGEAQSLGDYAGKALLIVNVASRCGLTPQYRGLEELHRTFADRGFAVLGFPCNQFGAQEPGSEAQIKAFCSSRYDVTFPMFAKVDVNGEGAHPLYAFLTAVDSEPEGAGKIAWNFGKFLIAPDGTVAKRFSPRTEPNSPGLVEAVEAVLPG